MKIDKIREMSDAELESQKNELLREKLTLRIQSRTGQLEKTARMREVRRDIARIMTEQTARSVKANG
ncbi:50S ribosomal protein L29 [Victivallis sp. Marseille-Q1083]|uniref:50S ribosomal protein L29 n=1 Tax=Victivallis sp. Marseille-Q1083 TaxID=2717288 RepID=UPI00158BA0B0|nr:50S ribosomal protein L29 [Victivallis sp. Marseille-Q1083]